MMARESNLKTKSYKFKGKIWKYNGPAGWHFVTLPKTLTNKIRRTHGLSEEGWGRLKAAAEIGKTKWSTAIWFDSKITSYILPIKALVRKAEDIYDGSTIEVKLRLQVEDSKSKLFVLRK